MFWLIKKIPNTIIYLYYYSFDKDRGPVLFSATRCQCFLIKLQVTRAINTMSLFLCMGANAVSQITGCIL